jgi:hypothetical protein
MVRVEGRVILLGSFDDEEEAAAAHDMAAAYFGLPGLRNFPDAKLPARSPREIRARRRKERSRSPYLGVVWIPSCDERPWYFGITIDGRTNNVGGYRTDKDACIARDRAFLALGSDHPLDFPREAKRLGPADLDTLRREVHATRKESCTSEYRGVTWDRERELWMAQINVDKRVYTLGRFDDEIDAACAFDAAALRLLDAKEAERRMNFPDADPRPEIRRRVALHPRDGTRPARRGAHASRSR